MAVFSQNQVQQLYVARAYKSGALVPSDTLGTIRAHSDSAKTHLYFQHVGAGGIVRSDLIGLDKIMNATVTPSAKMAYSYKKSLLTVDPNVGLVVGQDYQVRLEFRNFIGMSDEDQYLKEGIARVATGMTLDQFYTVLYNSLVMNMKRDITALCNVSLYQVAASTVLPTNTGVTVTAKALTTAGNSIKFAIASISAGAAAVTTVTANGITTITASLTTAAHTIADLKSLITGDTTANSLIIVTGTDATSVALDATATALTGGGNQGIYLEEALQPWHLGTFPVSIIHFSIIPLQVTIDQTTKETSTWGIVADVTPTTTAQNGKNIADLEYFCMGNRGDDYRMVKFPYVIPTTYLVDPTAKYDVLNVHYYSTSSNEGVSRAEKDITVVAADDGSHTLMNSIVTAVNATSGLSIATL